MYSGLTNLLEGLNEVNENTYVCLMADISSLITFGWYDQQLMQFFMTMFLRSWKDAGDVATENYSPVLFRILTMFEELEPMIGNSISLFSLCPIKRSLIKSSVTFDIH